MSEYYKVDEVVNILGLSQNTICNLSLMKKLPFIKKGRTHFFEKETIDNLKNIKEKGKSVTYVCKKLCYSRSQISNFIKNNKLKAYKIGKKYYILEEDITDFKRRY